MPEQSHTEQSNLWHPREIVCDLCRRAFLAINNRERTCPTCVKRGVTLDTVLGPIKVMPACEAQAVCVNGLRCWDAGRCLRCPVCEPAPGDPCTCGGYGS